MVLTTGEPGGMCRDGEQSTWGAEVLRDWVPRVVDLTL
jgi:hypothetical protein